MEKDVKGHLKKEVEGLVFPAEEQASKTKIDRQKKLEKLNMCEKRDDPVTHLKNVKNASPEIVQTKT